MAHPLLSDVTTLLTFFQTPASGHGPVVHFPDDAASYVKVIRRWAHFVAGITWIGLLYFFNAVNVPFQKQLDAPTKGKVVPALMPNALWYLRWGALVTVLVGLAYYGSYILATDAHNGGANAFAILGIWLLIILVTYTIVFFVTKPDGPLSKGNVLAIVIAIIVIVMAAVIVMFMGSYPGIGNKTISIGIGGGLGIIMLANVWSI